MNINEIAKLAGVSRATVSRYLNNGYVSEEKKERIRKIIEETGYQPSSSAQTLRSKKTNFIGVIIPKINSDSISRMVSGISSTLAGAGYQMLLACTHNHEKEELRFLNLFKENHVDGVILLGTIFTAEHRKVLKSLSVPIVILSQYLSGYSCVYSDDYRAAYDLTAYLAGTGTRIGYLGVTEKDEAVGKERLRGVREALQDNHQTLPDEYIRECMFDMESGAAQAKALLADVPDIDTVICATDTIAAGALQFLKFAGKRVPEDIQIAGIGDSSLSRVTEPSLTTVHLYYEEAGTEAARLLFDLIQNGEAAIQKEVKLDCKLIVQGSTRGGEQL
ncbi:LacI family DNA-binding transcriptional regulator [Ruminococcus gauvreauii]|uniref:LacI family DNA-binding transcriptional regulator n=1 Tax=Ruminococcus gauvreauii TaxID=438033 RepID=UPI003983E743